MNLQRRTAHHSEFINYFFVFQNNLKKKKIHLSFSTTKSSTTKTTTLFSSDSPDFTKTSSHENSPEIKFTEIRSNKRVHKTNESVGTTNGNEILDTAGIIDPKTGRTLTVGEAIQMRILDVRTGELIITENGERISLEEAVRRNLINIELVNSLLKPGTTEDHNGRKLSLLEVIQRDILEAENGYDTTEKRIKVTTIKTTGTAKSIADAIQDGLIDPKTGLYKISNENFITISEAYQLGYLVRHETVKIKSNALCLSDALTHGLVDTSGWITDRNTGDKFRLDSAIENGLIDPDTREIVDAKNDVKVSLTDALKFGILNAKTGRYMNSVTKDKLTFIDAKNRQLIIKPMTLKDVCDLNLLDKTGKINSPSRREKLSIIEAMNSGVLDSDHIKSVTRTKGELLTLSEALAQGVILPESKYKYPVTNEICSISDAVDRGLISSVSQKSIFNIDGFKDPHSGDFISLNLALSKNIIRRKSGQFVLDSGKGILVGLDESIETGLVRPEVIEMLKRPIGVFDSKKDEFSVIDLVYYDLIDPKSGYLLDNKTKNIIPLDSAIEQKIITPEGALLLSSLLNITLTTETVTKTVKRYVTVTDNVIPSVITFTEAVNQGYLNEEQQIFKDPVTGNVYSVQQALNHGFLSPDTEQIDVPSKMSTITIVKKSFIPEKLTETVHKTVEEPMEYSTILTETKVDKIQRKDSKTVISDFIQSEKEIFELPPDGWFLRDAIEQKLFDPISGLLMIPGTDRLVSFEECINLQIINPASVSVIDPNNGRKTTVSRSLEKKILDTTGHYKTDHTIQTMKDAIKSGKIIYEDPMEIDNSNQRLIQITKITGKPILVEVSNALNSNSPTFVEVQIAKSEASSPEPLQLAPGIIYDPSTALVIFTQTGQSETVLTAVVDGLVDPSLVKVVDPKTGREIHVKEAIKKGIVNPKTGEFKDKTGKKISLIEAVKFGALAVIGAPLIAAAGAIHSLKMVLDPKTGQQIPIELAVERGIISRDSLDLTPPQSLILIQDPVTGQEMPLIDAVDRGILTVKEAETLSQGELTRARITTEPKYKVSIGRVKSFTQSPEREARPVVLQKMRKKIVRPKDAVEKGMIDKETADLLEKRETFQSADGEPITLLDAVTQNKLNPDSGKIIDPQRGDVLTISQAIERGIFDPEGTNQLLVPIAKSLSVPQLKDQGLIDPKSMKIIHPETGAQLTLREAIICEIVDPFTILNPITGGKETLQQAIDNGNVDDNLSLVKTLDGSVDLLTAVQAKIFDTEDLNKPIENIPKVGMTFQIVVKRGLIDSETNEIIHPITNERQSIKDAIKDDFIMALPYPPISDSIEIQSALDSNLINSEFGTFKNPKTGEVIPISEAVETGILVIKPLPELVALHASGPITSVTETVTSYHTITTKTIELLSGYTLISADEVRNQQTGEIIPIEEAKALGIIRDESETKEKFATREIKVNFTDAVERGLVDMSAGTFTDPESGTVMTISQAVDDGILETESVTSEIKTEKMNLVEAYENIYDEELKKFRDPKNPERFVNLSEAMNEGIVDGKSIVVDIKTGKAQTLQDGVKQGLIDSKSGEIKQKTGSGISVKEAAKMGLLAVVGAPVLAGMAVADAIKKAVKKSDEKPIIKPDQAVLRPVDKLFEKPIQKSVEKPIEKSVVIPEKHVTFEIVEKKVEKSSRPALLPLQPILGVIDDEVERLAIGDAISQNKVEPRVCRILSDGKELPLTVQDALDQDQLSPLDVVDVFTKNIVGLVPEDKFEYEIKLNENLTPEQLYQIGVYNPELDIFIDPQTGEKITFQQLVYELNIFDPELIFVKDLSENTFEPLDVAFSRPLIDKNTGHMVDSKTGKRVPFFECIRRGWIIQRKPISEQTGSLQDVVDSGKFNPKTGEVIDEEGHIVQLAEALHSGSLDLETVSIKDPATGQVIPMSLAVERNIVDLQRGVIINVETMTEISISVAYQQGFLLAGNRKPISLEAVVNNQLYDQKSGKILDPVVQKLITIQESVDKGIIDSNISEIRDTKTNKLIPLQDALASNLISSETGQITDTKTGTLLTLDRAVDQKIITTKSITWSLSEALSKEYYDPKTGKFLDPMTGEEVTLHEAIKSGFLEVKTSLIKDDHKDDIIPANEAIESGLLDQNRGILTNPILTLDEAFLKGYLLNTGRPISLTDALLRGFYDPMTGLFAIDGFSLTLDEAIKKGEISVTDLIVKDPKTGNIISLAEAIRLGVVQPGMGLVVDPYSGLKMSLQDALERGILIQSKRRCSLPDAVFKGLYDPKSGQFSSTITTEKLSTTRAIRRGIIDPQSTIVSVNGKILPFELAVEQGLVDGKRGTVIDDYGNKIDFREAFDRGILIEVRKPISLIEALVKNIYDENTGLFMDPQTGKKITLSQALAKNVIDPNSVQAKDPLTGIYKNISLFEAIEDDLINGQNSKVLYEGRKITLRQAFDLGLLSDSKAPVSIQRAIHQGLYDDKTGKITDPVTGRKITIHEATRKFIINPQLPCYFNDREEKMISLAETCRSKLIDRREGVFKEPGSDVFIPLSEAMGLGLIVDIESAGFGLYEALAMGFYDRESGFMIHPVSGRKLTLNEAIKEDLISQKCSLIKNPTTGRYVRLDEAIKTNLIDDLNGIFVKPKLDLEEARKKGLIVTNQKLLSIEKCVKNYLYRPETGKFVDPSSGEYYDLKGAIDIGLIDPDTTVFKDLTTGEENSLKNAIESNDIDVVKGRVLDPKSKRSYNIDVALQKGLLVTVDKPITGKILVRRESIDLISSTPIVTLTPREMSLGDAITYEIINAETAVVKNPNTGKFIQLKQAIIEEIADIEKRAVIDPKSSFFVFDTTLIIYANEPITFDRAVETNQLNLSSAKFIDDPSQPEKTLTLKESVGFGLIDPESALVKDGAKKKLVRLPEAFRKGLVEAEKSNVLDTATSKLYSLESAVDSGLVITPKRCFGLLEAINYSLYNPTTGGFTDPFITTNVIDRKRLTLADAITAGLIDPTTTMVRDSGNSTIVPLVAALSSGLVDPIGGRLIDSESKEIDFIKAQEKGLLLPAEQRVSFILRIKIEKNFFLFYFLSDP